MNNPPFEITNTIIDLVVEIAELTGYSNYSHFSRAYTKYFSISPSDRRKQITEAQFLEEQNKDKNGMMFLDE